MVKRDDSGKLNFHVIDPPSERTTSFFLTTIDRQESIPPYSAPMQLNEYEDSAILVQGFIDSGILYSADVVEVAGPILTKVIQKIYQCTQSPMKK